MSKIYIKTIRMFENIICLLRKPYGENCDPNNTIDILIYNLIIENSQSCMKGKLY